MLQNIETRKRRISLETFSPDLIFLETDKLNSFSKKRTISQFTERTSPDSRFAQKEKRFSNFTEFSLFSDKISVLSK